MADINFRLFLLKIQCRMERFSSELPNRTGSGMKYEETKDSSKNVDMRVSRTKGQVINLKKHPNQGFLVATKFMVTFTPKLISIKSTFTCNHSLIKQFFRFSRNMTVIVKCKVFIFLINFLLIFLYLKYTFLYQKNGLLYFIYMILLHLKLSVILMILMLLSKY